MRKSLAWDVLDAVAENEGVEPEDLDFVLANHVDPDAVEQFAEHSDNPWRLEFELPEHAVTVTSNREILVDDLQKQS